MNICARAVEAARMIVEAGVDIIDVSGGLGGGRPEGLKGPGFFVPHAAAVKGVVYVPLWVRRDVEIESADGIIYEERNRVTLCRCGESQNKPLCDGSHFDI